jgi:guanylate kinase
MGAIKDLITTFVGDKLIELMKSGTNRIADEISQVANNKILEYLCEEYERNNRTKTILHRTEPIPLDSFYQPLFLRKDFNQWNGRLNGADTKRISTDSVRSVFEECKSNCLTIIGTAGSGKSTLVKYLFVNTIKERFKIPIKIELRELNKYDGNLIEYVKNDIIKFSEIAVNDILVEKLLKSGEFVIFFDGYDEVATSRKEDVTRDICKITRKYNKNKYILTSRPFVNIEMLDKFHNYQVCDLSMEEIKSFVKRQFDKSEQDLASKIIETINNEESATYKSFLSNPLLLSMFIITYQADSNIPQKRSDYYSQVFNTLYSAHDTTSKLGYSRERRCSLNKEQIMEILKRFSFTSFFTHNFSFSSEYVEQQFLRIKKDLGLQFSNDELLYDLKVSIGILTQDGLDITFPHRSLQEYFAALFVTSLADSNKQKVYTRLYDALLKLFEDSSISDDYLNFYSLLCEMDKNNFLKQLIIPLLNEIQNKIPLLKEDSEVINFFITLRSISYLIDKKMKSEFNKEHTKYNKQFSLYMNEEESKKVKKNTSEMAMFENARKRLASTDVIPFIKSYNYKAIVSKIEKGIRKTETIDSDFIDNLS